MYDVHIGIEEDAVDLALATLDRFTVTVATYADGDGWNCWGEPPGTDVNNATTRHVIARVDRLGQAIDLALALAEDGNPWREMLTPSDSRKHGGGTRLDGVLVTVSQSTDWAEQYLVVTEDGALLLTMDNITK